MGGSVGDRICPGPDSKIMIGLIPRPPQHVCVAPDRKARRVAVDQRRPDRAGRCPNPPPKCLGQDRVFKLMCCKSGVPSCPGESFDLGPHFFRPNRFGAKPELWQATMLCRNRNGRAPTGPPVYCSCPQKLRLVRPIPARFCKVFGKNIGFALHNHFHSGVAACAGLGCEVVVSLCVGIHGKPPFSCAFQSDGNMRHAACGSRWI